MSYCEKIRTEKVICDEIFYFEHVEEDVSIDYVEDIPAGSSLTGTVVVNILDCEVAAIENVFTIDVLFMLQKELEIITPGNQNNIQLEFAERFQEQAEFRKCRPQEVENLNIDLDQLYCYIVHTEGDDVITLDTENGTFDELLTIELKVKLLLEIQEVFKGCPPNQMAVLEINEQ